MDRREFVISAAAGLAAVGAAGQAAAASHAHHGSHGHADIDPKLAAVRASTADCVAAAADCERHCIELLGEGMTSMSPCLAALRRMQVVVVATGAVAGSETKPSDRMRELAAVCADFCRDCAKECEPHVDDHVECKACRDACLACADACDALKA